MAIKNYTSNIDPFVSIGEIQKALSSHGATKIKIDYDKGKPVAISFALQHPRFGLQGFMLLSSVDGTLRVFQKQGLKADRKQAERTAWRNIRDWVLAQIALIESCEVPVDQVFLPYLADGSGRTLYDVYVSGNLLPSAEADKE